MGVYERHVLPRIVEASLGTKGAMKLRRRVCAGLHGRVLELGFGSGLNVPVYPEEVTGVVAVEPSDLAWQRSDGRRGRSTVPVERVGLDGASVPLPDASCDTALSTWTLCTIPDVEAALDEVRRILRPGGRFHFLEHGLAPDQGVRRWQHRIEPVQKRIGGGCHLTRQIVYLLDDAGFVVDEVDVFYEPGAPKPFGADSLGVAVSP
ncbi:MAG: class I SAM-dependent methyltransferase [Actinomycetota bacterium]